MVLGDAKATVNDLIQALNQYEDQADHFYFEKN
jgi:hypothetical protein